MYIVYTYIYIYTCFIYTCTHICIYIYTRTHMCARAGRAGAARCWSGGSRRAARTGARDYYRYIDT